MRHGFQMMGLLLAVVVSGCPQQPAKINRIGVLCGLEVFATTVNGFKAKMAELGYVEGKDIVYDVQQTNFDPAAKERILRRFVADKVDLILVFPSEVAVAAKAVTQGSGIPVVFCQTNIEGTDLVQSVPEPGGHLTGVRYPGPDLALRRLEILHELAPQARRIWVPYGRNVQIVPHQLQALRPAAARAGVELVEAPADSAADLLNELREREQAADIGIDAILLISEPLARTPAVFPKIGKFAFEHRVPIGGVLYALEGYSSVFGVATDNLAVGRLAAAQAHKVLRGVPPGTIPVVSAESYFQLNYTVARALGLEVPEGLLKQADEIIR